MKNHESGERSRIDERQTRHLGERCPACLQRFEELLRAVYGEVHVNYRLPGMGAHPEDYKTKALRGFLWVV